MRAGAKFQAAVASWDDGKGGFQNRLLGSIPLRCGTDNHRVERVFRILDDMLDAVKELGSFFGLAAEDLPNYTTT
eukprot:SAG11_NODE_4727_length_1791_cov_1.012411_1_plen_74_part_10